VNSVLLPGVEIGDGALIEAFSLVNRGIQMAKFEEVPVTYFCTVDELGKKCKRISEPGVAYFNLMESWKSVMLTTLILGRYSSIKCAFFEDKGR
jgi:hypothetical protein